MSTYTTTWNEDNGDAEQCKKMGQYNTFALQVDGSSNPVAWLNCDPATTIMIAMVVQYGIYASNTKSLKDGTIMTVANYEDAYLGNAYTFDGVSFSHTGPAHDNSSIDIYNQSGNVWCVGLTKLDPLSSTMKPICADLVGNNQPALYTPIATIYAQMGKSYKTGAVIGHIGNLQKFELTSTSTTFHYNFGMSQWQQVNANLLLHSKHSSKLAKHVTAAQSVFVK
jgi:hypothetical protein